jgi:hypothetical protein
VQLFLPTGCTLPSLTFQPCANHTSTGHGDRRCSIGTSLDGENKKTLWNSSKPLTAVGILMLVAFAFTMGMLVDRASSPVLLHFTTDAAKKPGNPNRTRGDSRRRREKVTCFDQKSNPRGYRIGASPPGTRVLH